MTTNVVAPEPPWLSVIATTPLDAVAGKSTKKCFVDQRRWVPRDADFDNLLSAEQPDTGPCVVSTIDSTKLWTFVEVAAKIVGLGAGTSVKLLGQALIKGGHTISLPQGEQMVELTETGVKTGMRVDGWSNCAFLETGDEENPIAVAYVYCDDPQWDADVHSLGDGGRWRAGRRLLVRNLDASKL